MLGDCLDRHEDPPLSRIFGEKTAVAAMNPGHDRRLVMGKLLVIGQVAPKIPQRDPDETAACNRQHDRADKQKPKNFNHGCFAWRWPSDTSDRQTTVPC